MKLWTEVDKDKVARFGVFILLEDCDPSCAEDKTLPLNSYIVMYEFNGLTRYDIVQSHAKVKIFDSYYDRIGLGIKSIKWTSGTVNPKLYGREPSAPEKRKR